MEKKDIYVQKMKAKLDEWSAEIDRLQARSEQVEADLKLEYSRRMKNLQEKQDTAQEKLDNLINSSGQAWTEFKSGVESAWKSLEDSIQDVQNEFQ
jgi:short-subunit dehydrogenase